MARRRSVYYEDVRDGLGIEFIQAVRTAIEVILENPGMWPAFTQQSRAYRLHRFPYRLVYAVISEADEVLIVAVMHTSRDADYVSRRLEDSPPPRAP